MVEHAILIFLCVSLSATTTNGFIQVAEKDAKEM